jgi:hypothetical protein
MQHGYGSGLHTLPKSGTSLYCAWNRDNSGPDANIFRDTIATLRQKFPKARVRASTFDQFFKEAEKEREFLPLVTQEIGAPPPAAAPPYSFGSNIPTALSAGGTYQPAVGPSVQVTRGCTKFRPIRSRTCSSVR